MRVKLVVNEPRLWRPTEKQMSATDRSVARKSAAARSSRRVRRYAWGDSPNAYRARFPPASDWAMVPACVLRFYGRPQNSTFREDS